MAHWNLIEMLLGEDEDIFFTKKIFVPNLVDNEPTFLIEIFSLTFNVYITCVANYLLQKWNFNCTSVFYFRIFLGTTNFR